MSKDRRTYLRRYMRRYMRQRRREERGRKQGQVLSKGGDYRGGLGRGGEQEMLDFLLDFSLDFSASSKRVSWVVEQIRRLQDENVDIRQRVTLLESERALLEAQVRQAEEWSE